MPNGAPLYIGSTVKKILLIYFENEYVISSLFNKEPHSLSVYGDATVVKHLYYVVNNLLI